MANKYKQSFEVDTDEKPVNCPICGHKFNYSEGEDIDTWSYKDGYRTMLICPKCNFKKVLSYQTEENIEKEMNEIYEDNEDNEDGEF